MVPSAFAGSAVLKIYKRVNCVHSQKAKNYKKSLGTSYWYNLKNMSSNMYQFFIFTYPDK